MGPNNNVYISIIILYLIGQNFCKKPKNYFSVDQTKKDNNQNLYLKSPKNIGKKYFWPLFFFEQKKTVIILTQFETGKHIRLNRSSPNKSRSYTKIFLKKKKSNFPDQKFKISSMKIFEIIIYQLNYIYFDL